MQSYELFQELPNIWDILCDSMKNVITYAPSASRRRQSRDTLSGPR